MFESWLDKGEQSEGIGSSGLKHREAFGWNQALVGQVAETIWISFIGIKGKLPSLTPSEVVLPRIVVSA
jgi:hypothetical protein